MRFTIRDMLWVMVVIGLACGWHFTTRREIARHQREEDEARLYWARAQFEANNYMDRVEAVAKQYAWMERNLNEVATRLRKLEDASPPRLDLAPDPTN